MLPSAVRMNDTQQGQNIKGTIKSRHSDVTGLAKILALTLQEECRTKDECRTTEPAAFISPVSLLTHGNSPKPGMGQPSHNNAKKESAHKVNILTCTTPNPAPIPYLYDLTQTKISRPNPTSSPTNEPIQNSYLSDESPSTPFSLQPKSNSLHTKSLQPTPHVPLTMTTNTLTKKPKLKHIARSKLASTPHIKLNLSKLTHAKHNEWETGIAFPNGFDHRQSKQRRLDSQGLSNASLSAEAAEQPRRSQ